MESQSPSATAVSSIIDLIHGGDNNAHALVLSNTLLCLFRFCSDTVSEPAQRLMVMTDARHQRSIAAALYEHS